MRHRSPPLRNQQILTTRAPPVSARSVWQPLRQHSNLVHGAPAHHIQRLLVGSAENHVCRSGAAGNRSEMFSLRTEDLNALCGRVQSSGTINDQPIAAADDECAMVSQSSVRL